MTDSKIVKILVASPSDVDEERLIVEQVIEDWNTRNSAKQQLTLMAVLWEKHAAPENTGDGGGPQPRITRQIVDDCDCAIGIFWNRIGTPTVFAEGGAVEEVHRMLTILKRPVMVYFSNAPIARKKFEKEQVDKLDAFKKSMQSDGLIWEYDSTVDFRIMLTRHLDLNIDDWFFSSIPLKTQLPTVELLRRYQATLKHELGYIHMIGVPGIASVKVNLNDDTFVPLRLFDRQGAQNPFPQSPDETMKLGFKKSRMLLAIGDPGAGKTTLLKYYALCAFDPDGSKRLGFGGPVNVFYLPLLDLVGDKGMFYNDSLPVNLTRWYKKRHQTLDAQLFEEWLHSGTSLVLLDGLDEISDTAERIEVCRWIDKAWSGFSKAYFVVTSRATGYNKDDGVELEADHERADVQDFTEDQQERFLRKWFTAVFLNEPCYDGMDEAEWDRQQRAEAEERTIVIVAHLKDEKNKGLLQLAAIPMILQIMAILWMDRDYMPENRVKLYEAALDYILEFRDKRRKIKPLLSAVQARQVLAPVALWMQETIKKDEVTKVKMHTAMQEWLDTLDTPPAAEPFCDYLVERAGLLVETEGEEYLFRHKSFREYLAGVRLKEDRPYEHLNKLVAHFGEDWWEEPIRFFIGSVDANVFDAFMDRLFDSKVSEELSIKQQLLLQTIIDEATGKKVDALCTKLLNSKSTVGRQRVILDCLKNIGKTTALNALKEFIEKNIAINDDIANRAKEVFFALAGQPFSFQSIKFVGGTITSICNPNEQNAEYIMIPGGSYIYSVTRKEEHAEDLYFAKYPVTNRLYRSFISALQSKGFEDDPLFSFSTFLEKLNAIAENNEWGKGFVKELNKGKHDLASFFRSDYYEDRKFGGDDQPVVGVTWYAAQAYCLWLSLQECDNVFYRLPTEIEWEWAAGGSRVISAQPVRRYPWSLESGEPNSMLANYNQHVGFTTPVSSYPEGMTTEGLYNMAGNVWELMQNWYDDTDEWPARRGGSWSSSSDSLRCSSRLKPDPRVWTGNIGFRVVRSR